MGGKVGQLFFAFFLNKMFSFFAPSPKFSLCLFPSATTQTFYIFRSDICKLSPSERFNNAPARDRNWRFGVCSWLLSFLAFWLFCFFASWLFCFFAFWLFSFLASWLLGFLAFWRFGFLADADPPRLLAATQTASFHIIHRSLQLKSNSTNTFCNFEKHNNQLRQTHFFPLAATHNLISKSHALFNI